jgi:hypothetical protein
MYIKFFNSIFQLESIAQRWADQCNFGLDTVRNVKRFQVGQSVFVASSTDLRTTDWRQAINSWYDGVQKADGNIVDKFV